MIIKIDNKKVQFYKLLSREDEGREKDKEDSG